MSGAGAGALTGGTWRLEHADGLVAALHVTAADFPWLTARVERGAAFPVVARLLADELRLGVDADEETPEWLAVYRGLRAQTRLLDPEGHAVREYLLHLDAEAGEAWWRWADEPFEDD